MGLPALHECALTSIRSSRAIYMRVTAAVCPASEEANQLEAVSALQGESAERKHHWHAVSGHSGGF